MGAFKWYANWYIILVGPPGLVKKSTTVDVAMNILREVEGVNFGPDCTTWEGFIAEVAKAKDVFATGGNTGSLMDQEYAATSALTMAISEWGTFLDPNNYIMVNVLTDLWDCKDTEWRKTTKTQGSDVIVAPFLNMIAGTTPQWMLQNFRGQFGGWGFSSRCIFMHCAEAERSVAYPDELWGAEMHSWRDSFVSDLREIASMEGGYVLAPEARELGREWYAGHQKRITAFSRHPNSDPWTGYFLARKQTHAHKLALCLAAGRRNERVITRADLAEALDKCDEIEGELSYIFGKRVGQTRDVKLNLDVWRGLERAIGEKGRIREKDAFRYTIEFMPYGKAKELIENLVRGGFLAREVDGATACLVFGAEQMTIEVAAPALE